jgi:transcriptional regulator with XRE-family HTH domain
MIGVGHDPAMDDLRLGSVFRAVRLRHRLRQEDVALGAGVDRMWISRVEHGHLGAISIARLRAIAGVLEVRLDIVPSWRGGEVARVVNERHSRMHELFAAHLTLAPGWAFATEVTFSRFGERGVIDILAWHAARRVVLVVELTTEIPDPAGLIAQVDRYRRLAPEIARDRGWIPVEVAAWVLVAESDMNRRQLARHKVMLRNAFPLDGRALRRWLGNPAREGAGAANGLAFLANAGASIANRRLGPTKRVRARPILANAAADRQQRAKRGLQGRPGVDHASPGAPDAG